MFNFDSKNGGAAILYFMLHLYGIRIFMLCLDSKMGYYESLGAAGQLDMVRPA
jgi:hypothetical protein